MSFESQVEQLTENTKAVFRACTVENGAIIAANTDLPYYPETAVNYRYVWPRDAAFTLYAADLLGLSADMKANFVQWLLNRAEGFADSGIIIKRYATNGRHDLRYGHEYQPDQAGAMLWALHHTSQEPDTGVDRVINLLATGLSEQWEDNHFIHPNGSNLPVQDVWEDQLIQPPEQNVFTYSLATAIYGLEQATIRLGDTAGPISESWSFAVESMRKVLKKVDNQPYYPWKLPPQSQERQIDASLSGLLWPFEVNPQAGNTTGIATIRKIEEILYEPSQGIKRYPEDHYDGVDKASTPAQEAGTWPLLSFWYAIVLKKSGMNEAADQIYRETLDRLPNDYIPEQLLPSDRSDRPPAPLAWAHAMFIIASRELGYLN